MQKKTQRGGNKDNIKRKQQERLLVLKSNRDAVKDSYNVDGLVNTALFRCSIPTKSLIYGRMHACGVDSWAHATWALSFSLPMLHAWPLPVQMIGYLSPGRVPLPHCCFVSSAWHHRHAVEDSLV
jgi:hypothetical protein